MGPAMGAIVPPFIQEGVPFKLRARAPKGSSSHLVTVNLCRPVDLSTSDLTDRLV